MADYDLNLSRDSQPVTDLNTLRGMPNPISNYPDRPEWTDPGRPIQERVGDIFQAHAQERMPWEEFADNFKHYFGGDPQGLRQSYEMSAKLAGYREGAKSINEQDWGWWLNTRLAPFATPLVNMANQEQYAQRRQRFEQGSASEQDLRDMAFYERMEALKGNPLVETAIQLPRQALEMYIGGQALKGLGLYGQAARQATLGLPVTAAETAQAATATGAVGQHLLRGSAFVATQPGIWASEYGKQRMEGSGVGASIAKTVGMSGIQAAVFGTLSRLPEAIPGEGVGPWLARTGAGTGAGLVEQQVVDVLASAAHLDTGYGVIGDLVRGNKGEALARLTQQALAFSVFSAMHGGNQRPIKEMPDAIREARKAGYTDAQIEGELGEVHAGVLDALQKYPDMPVKELRDKLDTSINGPMGDYTQSLLDGLDELDELEKRKTTAGPVHPDQETVWQLLERGKEQKPWLFDEIKAEAKRLGLSDTGLNGLWVKAAQATEPPLKTRPPKPGDRAAVHPEFVEPPPLLQARPPRPGDVAAVPAKYQTAIGQRQQRLEASMREALETIRSSPSAENRLEPAGGQLPTPEPFHNPPFGPEPGIDRPTQTKPPEAPPEPPSVAPQPPEPPKGPEAGPGQLPTPEAKPESQEESAADYAQRMRQTVTKKGLNPALVEKVVSESGAKNRGEWDTYADENEVPFRNNRTMMNYARALVEAIKGDETGKGWEETTDHSDAHYDLVNAGLTEKELGTVASLLRGRTLREVAEELGVSHQTISNWANKIRDKLAEHFGKDKSEIMAAWDAVLAGQKAEKAGGETAFGETEDVQQTKEGRSFGQMPIRALLSEQAKLNRDLARERKRADRAGTVLSDERKAFYADRAADIQRRLVEAGAITGSERGQSASVQPETVNGVQEGGSVPEAPSEGEGTPGATEGNPQAAPAATERGTANRDELDEFSSGLASPKAWNALFDFARKLFAKFNPMKEAPDETAEVQAAAREAAQAAGLSKAAGDAQAQALIAEVNAKAHEAALNQFANQLGGQTPTHPSADSRIAGAVNRFLADERGSLDLNVIGAYGRNLYDGAITFFRRGRDGLNELSGRMFPRSTGMSRTTGEKMAHYVSVPTWVKEAVPAYIDKVMGPDGTPAERVKAGALMTEMHLKHTRDAFIRQGETEKADAVTSILGAQGSPLKDEADYQAALADPRMQAIIERYRTEMVPLLNQWYARAEGLEEGAEINTLTQVPGLPMNLKGVREGDEITPTTVQGIGAAGNLRNVSMGKLVFSRERTGATGSYDIDLGRIIENSFTRAAGVAAKADMVRTAVEEGVAQWADARPDGFKEVPFVRPPRGTQENAPGEKFYVHDDAYKEWRSALAVDEPFKIPGVTQAANLLSKTALASTVEAAYHSRNLLTMLTKPGMNPVDIFKNGFKLITGDAGIRDSLVELARIGALKGEGFANERSPYDPRTWAGRFLDLVDRSMRLTANDAFDRLKRWGYDIEDTETNRRDFINQLGQYNKRAQSKAVQFLRDTGLGPFATAGTNYYMQGLRSLFLDPGVKANTWQSQLALHTEVLARQATALGAVALANWLLWKRLDGDDSTPLGGIKTGEGPDGKSRYFDLAGLFSPLPRGLRETGLMALLEGERRGERPAAIIDRAKWDAVEAALHPMLGPPGAFAYTAATGKNTLGMQIANKPEPGGSQSWENLKAALKTANPVVGSLTGADRPGEEQPLTDRAAQLLGPYNWMRSRSNPAVSDFYDTMQAAQQAHQQFTQNRQRGLTTPGYGPNELAQYRKLAIAQQRLAILNRQMRAAKTDEEKARIRTLQVQAAQQALGR